MSDEHGAENEWPVDRPWTDETGDVDLTALAENMRLTVWERAEKHYQARMFVQMLRQAGRAHYGPAFDELTAEEAR